MKPVTASFAAALGAWDEDRAAGYPHNLREFIRGAPDPRRLIVTGELFGLTGYEQHAGPDLRIPVLESMWTFDVLPTASPMRAIRLRATNREANEWEFLGVD